MPAHELNLWAALYAQEAQEAEQSPAAKGAPDTGEPTGRDAFLLLGGRVKG